jgi:hypothetical protein
MKNKDKVTSIAPLHYQSPQVSKESLPSKYKSIPIDYKSKEIGEYEVLFFHRLMKKNYGYPSDIEVEEDSIRKLENGQSVALGREWRYYVSTATGSIIQVSTEDVHTQLKISLLLQTPVSEPSRKQLQEAKKFVNDLLREAQRLKGQIPNIKNEFENGVGVRLALLSNVYLFNYRSAQLMLEYADDNEQYIKDEVLRYDARNSLTPDQRNHIDKFRPALGMYYAASLSYFFMALEGYINILYYTFLKDEIKSDFLKQYDYMDITTKILLLPSLCHGFKDKQKSAFLEDVKHLKNYRNFLFHSKITDSLKTVTFMESGFFYTCDFDRKSEGGFPSHKDSLSREKVLEFKKLVDSIVQDIIGMLQEDIKPLVLNYVMHSLEIPFWYDKNGIIHFGAMDKQTNA